MFIILHHKVIRTMNRCIAQTRINFVYKIIFFIPNNMLFHQIFIWVVALTIPPMKCFNHGSMRALYKQANRQKVIKIKKGSSYACYRFLNFTGTTHLSFSFLLMLISLVRMISFVEMIPYLSNYVYPKDVIEWKEPLKVDYEAHLSKPYRVISYILHVFS